MNRTAGMHNMGMAVKYTKHISSSYLHTQNILFFGATQNILQHLQLHILLLNQSINKINNQFNEANAYHTQP
jgi:hypothetical protein